MPEPKPLSGFTLINPNGPVAMPTGEWTPESYGGGGMSRSPGMGTLSAALLAGSLVLPGCTPSSEATPTPTVTKTELPSTSVTFEINDLTSAYRTSTDPTIKNLLSQLESKHGTFQDSWALSAFENGNKQAVDTIQFFDMEKAHMVGFWTKDAQDRPIMQNPGALTGRYMYNNTSGELTYELMVNGTDTTVSQSFLKLSTTSNRVVDLSALVTSANSGDAAARAELDVILSTSQGNFLLTLSNLATGRTDIGTLSSDQMTAVPPTAEPDNQISILDRIMQIGVTPVAAMEPTVTPTVAPTEVPLVQQPIGKLVTRNFAAVATAAGFVTTPEQLQAQGFLIKTITGADGKTYEVATVHLDPNPNKQGEEFEGDYPLMIKNEQGEWKTLSLTRAFEVKGKEAQVRGEPGGGVQVPALVNFGGVSVTTTLEGTVGYVDVNGWSVPDGFTEMTNHPIIGQIAWGFEPILPPSVKNLPPDQLQAFAISEINEVITHFLQKYPNKRFDFIVAGESTHQTLYHKKLGDPNVYLIEQYKAADKAITDAGRTRAQDGGTNGDKLGYSDFISGVNDPNLANIIGIAKTLKSQNLLDVVYLQLRYVGSPNINPSQPPTREQLSALSERIFNESGVHVIFSEVGIKGNGDPRTIFENTVGGCMDSPACLGVQFYAVGQAEDGDNQFPIFDTKDGKDVPNLLYYDIMRLVLES